jgi:hypothetical protein
MGRRSTAAFTTRRVSPATPDGFASKPRATALAAPMRPPKRFFEARPKLNHFSATYFASVGGKRLSQGTTRLCWP